MQKLLLALIPIILAGCASAPVPMSIPMPPPAERKCISIPGKGCQPITAGNVGGTTLGNHDEDSMEENSR